MNLPDKGMSDAIRRYDANAANVFRRYEAVAAETVRGWLVDCAAARPSSRRSTSRLPLRSALLIGRLGTLENPLRIIADTECGP